MSTSTPPLNDLVEKIRAKYPGEYDDMDDATLTKKVLAKYPEYSDLAAPKIQPPSLPGALGKSHAQQMAAGPYTEPGAAEEEMVGGVSTGQFLKDSARGPAMGLATVAPMLTGGASLPVQAAVSGAAGAAQSKLEGGSNKEAAVSGAIGAALPVVGKGVGKAVSYFSSEGVQNDIKGAVKGLMGKVSQEAGVTPEATPSIRKSVEQTADAIEAKGKGIYATIDQATDGKFESTKNALKNVSRKIADIHGTNPDAEGALIERQNALEDTMNKMWEDAKAKGVDPKMVDAAKANWKKAQALYDLDKHVKLSTSGVEPHTSETVDPKKLSGRLEKMYDSGRLQEAVGDDGAAQLLKESHAAEVRMTKLKTAKKVAGGALAITGAEEGARRLLK